MAENKGLSMEPEFSLITKFFRSPAIWTFRQNTCTPGLNLLISVSADTVSCLKAIALGTNAVCLLVHEN
jgi:hypothetical protein